jgi:hypothetical protein
MRYERANNILFLFWIIPFFLTVLLIITVFAFILPYGLPEKGDGSLFGLILNIVHLNVPYLLAMASATAVIHWRCTPLQTRNIRLTTMYPIFGVIAIYQSLIILRTIIFIHRNIQRIYENYDVYLASLQSLSTIFQYILPAALFYFYLGSTNDKTMPNNTREKQT